MEDRYLFCAILAAALLFCLRCGSASAYYSQPTHSMLTKKSADFYNYLYKQDLSEEYISEIIKGAINEDTPPRWINHFYDPLTGDGWQGEKMGHIPASAVRQLSQIGLSTEEPVSALDWARNQVLQSRYSLYEGNKTFEKAVYEYVKGDKKKAYRALGHVLHLMQDMAVPAHTRQDTHSDILGDSGEPYEAWVGQYGNLLHLSDSYLADNYFDCAGLDNCFIKIAKYSSGNFFSEDTILDERYNKIIFDLEQKGRYWYGIKDGYYLFIGEEDINGDLINLTVSNSNIHQSNWDRLSGKAVIAGTEAIRIFHEYAAMAEKDHSLIEEPPKSSATFFLFGLTGFPVVSVYGQFVKVKNFSVMAAKAAVGAVSKAADSIAGLFRKAAESISGFKASISDIIQNSTVGDEDGEVVFLEAPELLELQETQEIGIFQEEIVVVEEPARSEFLEPEIILEEILEQSQELISEDIADSAGVSEENKKEPKSGNNSLSPSPPPPFKFFIGGGGSAGSGLESEPVIEEESESNAGPETQSPIILPVPEITSHSNLQLLGIDRDFSTSTDGFQINLAGNSLPGLDVLIFVNSNSTKSGSDIISVGADEKWDKIISLEHGENEIIAKAKDSNGNESNETGIILFVDVFPPSQIADLSASFSDSQENISLSWTSPGDDGFVGTAAGYIIKYSTSSLITVDNWDSSIIVDNSIAPSVAGSAENFIIDNLPFSQEYYFAVQAYDDAGNLSDISGCILSSPPAQVENLVISEVAAGDNGNTKNEFVEIYNPANEPINLAGWSLQYNSSHATSSWKYKYFDVGGEASYLFPDVDLAGHGYYLLTSGIDNENYLYNTQPDLTAATQNNNKPTHLGLAGNGGKVRLLDNNGEVVDLVAWGKDSIGAEGIPVDIDNDFSWGSLERKAGASSTAEALAVNGSQHWLGNSLDTDDNSNDFVLQSIPNPQNSLCLTEPRDDFPILADTPWPIFGQNNQHTSKSSYAGSAVGGPTTTPKWIADLSDFDHLSPVIGLNEEIYVAGSSGIGKVSRAGEVEIFYGASDEGIIQAPVIASDGTIYIADSHYVYALSSDGRLKWRYLAIDSSLTIGSDGKLYIGSQQHFFAVTPNGETIWEKEYLGGGYLTSASVDNQKNLYTAGRFGAYTNFSRIYKIDSEIGFVISSSTSPIIRNFPIGFDGQGNLYSVANYNVLIHDSGDLSLKKTIGSEWGGDSISGNLAIDNDNSAAYFGTQQGWIIKVNTDTLEKVYSENWPVYAGGGRVGGITVDADGAVYAGTESGRFYAFNPDGTIKWLYDTGESIIQPAVIDSEGIIYVISQKDRLWAFGE